MIAFRINELIFYLYQGLLYTIQNHQFSCLTEVNDHSIHQNNSVSIPFQHYLQQVPQPFSC